MVKNKPAKISYANWKSSIDKWDKAVEKTKNRESFYLLWGFEDLAIVKKCGYCFEFTHYHCVQCDLCPLYKRGICDIDREEDGGATIFWQYVEEMEKSCYDPDDVDWARALMLAEKIRDEIAKDEPLKKDNKKIKK